MDGEWEWNENYEGNMVEETFQSVILEWPPTQWPAAQKTLMAQATSRTDVNGMIWLES